MNFFLQGPNIVNKHATDKDVTALFGDMSGNVEPVEVIDVDR